MEIFEAYFKKDLTYNYQGKSLTFRVSQSLFSSHDVDLGTHHLLQTLYQTGVNEYKKVLDLGCGVGLIGISLGSAQASAEIHMVDRDALALEYSKQNAELNNVMGTKIYGSLGYDDVSDVDFDLIVSNIPAKVGEKVLSHILEDAKFHIQPNGLVAVVVIDAIGDFVTKVLTSNKDIKIVFYKRWPGYLVFHYQFISPVVVSPRQSAFESGMYRNSEKEFVAGGKKFFIETTHNLAEFDTLSFETKLLIEKIGSLKKQKIQRALVINPGQGIVPVALALLEDVKEIDLLDRDLQALKISKKNLITNGFPSNKIFSFHEIIPFKINRGFSDFITVVLKEKDVFAVHSVFIEEVSKQISETGIMLLVAGSTPITRLESFIRKNRLLQVLKRQKSRGKSILSLKKRTNT